MPELVLDASVLCNRLLNQPLSKEARSVFASDLALVAPALARLEAASALWLAVKSGKLTHAEATERFDDVERLPIDFVNDPTTDVLALQLALEHNLSPYDAEYIALAIAEECALVTADRKQHEIARDRCGLGRRAVWLGDV